MSPFAVLRNFFGVAVVAALLGWQVHKGAPTGLVLPQNVGLACPPFHHGFGYTFATVMGVAAGAALAVAIALYLLSRLGIFTSAQGRLVSAAKAGVATATALAIGMLLRWPIEANLPLLERPACEAKPGNAPGRG